MQQRPFEVTHGMAGTKVYRIWKAMKKRCGNPNYPEFHLYGGRGIRVCNRWLAFEDFYADMGDPPLGYSLDRIDSNGNYEPNNCRWASAREQQSNRRNTSVVEFEGRRWTWRQLSERFGLRWGLIRDRVEKLGWPIERAVSEPAMKKFGPKAGTVYFDGRMWSWAALAATIGMEGPTLRSRVKKLGWSLEQAMQR